MEAEGRYRLDAAGQVHEVLTAFGRAVAAAGQPATARAYTYTLCGFFACLDTDPGQRAAGRRWDAPPAENCAAIAAYRAANSAGAAVLLAALRRFYRMQFAAGATPTLPRSRCPSSAVRRAPA